MHHLPRFFKSSDPMDPRKNPKPRKSKGPKLDRRNAAKHIDYDASSSSSSLYDSSSSSSLVTRSLDLSDRTSFRIEGVEGEFDRICRSLGLSGPEDFSIPTAAWEARKIRSTSDILPRSRLNRLDSPTEEDLKEGKESEVANELCDRVLESVTVRDCDDATELISNESTESSQSRGGGIKGARPPVLMPPTAAMTVTEIEGTRFASIGGGDNGARELVLKPPPAMTLPAIDDTRSTWDIFRDLSAESERGDHIQHFSFSSSSSGDDVGEEEEDRDGDVAVNGREEEGDENAVLSEESCSFTTSNDDDSSSTTTNPSPNGRFRRLITTDWQKGELLGRGSFGSVYEGISR
ncbi:hypothetical protein CFOL_v3_02860 [Cephalotus follicularis]|uniref:Pkinase domain-containing protein n=1 Tax=Cephalotus follicularis TaxID=3775 RepID=A0A1Q3AUE5_CEPFO|nr:hypothetical protein CFOL_v3_02860 [Cephalotus follicularis]